MSFPEIEGSDQCQAVPTAELPIPYDGASNYVVLDQALTEQDVAAVSKVWAADEPLAGAGDEAYTNRGVAGNAKFRVGQRWFELQVRPAEAGSSDFDSTKASDLIPTVTQQVAATIPR